MNPYTKFPHAMPVLVTYECGCVGFPPDGDSMALLVFWCERGDERHSFGMRSMVKKTFEPMPPKRVAEIIATLADLVMDGIAYSDLAFALRRAVK